MNVHFVLDESATLGHMESLDDAVNMGRGYGLNLTFIYQSLGQLRKCFPDGQEQTLLSNVTQIFFGVNDLQTAEYVSNRLGEHTLVVGSGGTSRGTSRQHSQKDANGSFGTSWNGNDNWQLQARKLLKPEEVMALSPRTAITFTTGVRPIATQLIRYYEERPDSLWQKLMQGLKATCCAIVLLATAVIAARTVATSYQYRLKHPPARAVRQWQVQSRGVR